MQQLAAKAPTAPTRSTEFVAKLDAAARRVGHGARPRSPAPTIDRARRRCWSAGDIVIDGGNSYYRDDIRRAAELAEQGIHYVDVGTSGGVFGLERGYCLMIGGETDGRAAPRPDLRDARSRRRRRAPHARARPVEPATAEQGYLHCGPAGAGHFVKMVHNGIEYGLMAAYAEGLNILTHANVGKPTHATSTPRPRRCATPSTTSTTSTSPTSPRCGGAGAWSRRGCSTSTAHALSSESPTLAELRGPGLRLRRGPLDRRWPRSTRACPRRSSPPRCSSASRSRGEADFADQLLSAMRKEFGGHDEKKP